MRSSKALKGRLEIEARASGEVPDGSSRLVRIAGDGEIALEDRPRLVREAGAVRGAGKETLGDLAGAASADARDARDRQDVLDEGFGGLRRLTLDRREQARMASLALAVGFASGCRALARHDGADDASLGGRRDFQARRSGR